jgi:hypothetical protein
MSGALVESGTVDATGIVVTGGTAKFDDVQMLGGALVFRNAQVDGGVLSVAGANASSGQISFDGTRIADGEVNCSGMVLQCSRSAYPDLVRFSMDKLTMTGGLLTFEDLRPMKAKTEQQYEPDDGSAEPPNDRVMSLDAATVSGGRISFNHVRVRFGTVSIAGLRLREHGTIDCTWMEILPDANLDFSDAEISGGTLDFANAVIGGDRHSAGSSRPIAWIDRLEEESNVEGRDVVFGDRHPAAHLEFHDSIVENGRISFADATVNGGLISFIGIKMAGGRIGFDGCTYAKAVVSLWNARIYQDAIVDFTNDKWGLLVIVYSAAWDGLANVRVGDRHMLLEVSASD